MKPLLAARKRTEEHGDADEDDDHRPDEDPAVQAHAEEDEGQDGGAQHGPAVGGEEEADGHLGEEDEAHAKQHQRPRGEPRERAGQETVKGAGPSCAE